MAQTRPNLIDQEALLRNRARAHPVDARFLHDAARDEIEERLIDVNRTFTSPALITAFPELWDRFLPSAPRVFPREVLALDQAAYDLVVHAMALHWAEDPVGQLIQCARALKPDGLLLAVCFGGETLHELRASLAQAESEITGGLSPRVAPMAEIRDLGQLLGRAGLALPVADTLRLTASYGDITALARDVRAMGEGNALTDRSRHPTRPSIFRTAQSIYADAFPSEDGRLAATFDLMFLTGWKPHASQQQPLRPGSAEARLAEALETREFNETGAPILDPVLDQPANKR
jgi:SAM-dependent methyltransferase